MGAQKTFTGLLAIGLMTATAMASELHWGYDGEAGPDNWGALSEDFQTCTSGAEQSPIDLVQSSAIKAAASPINISWTPFVPALVDNGHTLQVNAGGKGGFIEMNGVPYQLLQFHFHHQSEHAFNGVRSPLEAHFVHQSEAGDLLVLGVMMQAGEEHPAFNTIEEGWPESVGTEVAGAEEFDPASLLPNGAASFRYQGSLTTPPCSQVAFWNVFAEPIEVSDAQIAKFAEKYPGNARPLQPLNRRFLLLTEE